MAGRFGRVHPWIWLCLGLLATGLSGRLVRDRMLAAGRADQTRYCDSLDELLTARIESPRLELVDIAGHLASDDSRAPLLAQLDRAPRSLNSVWTCEQPGTPTEVWSRPNRSHCPVPTPERLALAAAALDWPDRGGRVAPVPCPQCDGCMWLAARAGPGEPRVLAEVELEELLGPVGQRLASLAAGSLSIRAGDTTTPLLEWPESRPVDPLLTERREVPVLDGQAVLVYEVRHFADAWTTLRPMVWWTVQALGALASLLLFFVLRMLVASVRREARLLTLGNELRRRDRDIEHRRAQAEAASAAKSDLLRRTSHNMRSPLTSILGLTETVLGAGPEPWCRARLEAVSSSATHLLALANDLLDIARAESGKISTTVQDVDPVGLLEEVAGGFRDRARSRGLALGVMWERPAPAFVRTDPTRLREILHNLLDNAIRHTARGGVSIAACVDDTGDRLHLDIIDTGQGIEPERLPGLFEAGESGVRFSSDRGMHGMGLAITRDLVAAMGGDIRVDSRVGIGTVFSIDLPITPRDIHDAGTLTPTVLVVDDAPEIGQLMRLSLGAMGLGTEVVDSGEAARAAAAGPGSAAYRVVFLDQHLSDATGTELLAALRGLLPRTAFVALTGDAHPGAERRYLDAGFDAYLAKPFRQSQLAGVLGRFGCAVRSRAA